MSDITEISKIVGQNFSMSNSPISRSSVIINNYTNKTETADADDEEQFSQILETVQLILSQTSTVNLMCIPTHYTRKLEERIQEANKTPGMFTPEMLLVAQMELAFLQSKERVSFWTESVTLDRLLRSLEENVCPPMIFTSVQVNPY